MAETLKANLLIPEVIGDMVETSLGNRITLLPVVTQDNTLQGRPGDTLKFPSFTYIGKADAIAENNPITAALLTSSTVSVQVKKYAKAVAITDEARLSGYGDPVGEAARQLAHSIDHAMDDALFDQLKMSSYSRLYPITALSADAVADALTLFGEELDGPKILLTNAAGFATLRKDADYIQATDLGQRMIFSGVVGEIWGCQVVVSNKIANDTGLKETRYFILKPGALRLVSKQGTTLEVERDAKYMRDTLYASKHAAAYLYDESKMVALTIPTGVGLLADGAPSNIHTVAGTTGKTKIVIPDKLAPAPTGTKWVYKLDTNDYTAYTFGTAITGYTDWTSSTTEIAVSTNTYAHVVLVYSADSKPIKAAHPVIVAGA